jgi:hypothetical protein
MKNTYHGSRLAHLPFFWRATCQAKNLKITPRAQQHSHHDATVHFHACPSVTGVNEVTKKRGIRSPTKTQAEKKPTFSSPGASLFNWFNSTE